MKLLDALRNEHGDIIIANDYKVKHIIGSGGFCDVYFGRNIHTREPVAIKIERPRHTPTRLYMESKMYENLKAGTGFPRLRHYCKQGGLHILILELLGPSLEDCLNYCSRRFSAKTVLLLCNQMLLRLQYVHSLGIVHRDLKPQNFLMGLKNNRQRLYLTDFGLAKRYIDPHTSEHISNCFRREPSGTARYISINTHIGMQQSRRDDLESLGYVLVYLKQGSLPWQGLEATNRMQQFERIAELKISIPLSVLCLNMEIEFATYLNYCRNLSFEEQPNYGYLRQLFLNLLRAQINMDLKLDWHSEEKPATEEAIGEHAEDAIDEQTDTTMQSDSETTWTMSGVP